MVQWSNSIWWPTFYQTTVLSSDIKGCPKGIGILCTHFFSPLILQTRMCLLHKAQSYISEHLTKNREVFLLWKYAFGCSWEWIFVLSCLRQKGVRHNRLVYLNTKGRKRHKKIPWNSREIGFVPVFKIALSINEIW